MGKLTKKDELMLYLYILVTLGMIAGGSVIIYYAKRDKKNNTGQDIDDRLWGGGILIILGIFLFTAISGVGYQ